jgi:hypothetical protein
MRMREIKQDKFNISVCNYCVIDDDSEVVKTIMGSLNERTFVCLGIYPITWAVLDAIELLETKPSIIFIGEGLLTERLIENLELLGLKNKLIFVNKNSNGIESPLFKPSNINFISL